MRVLEDADVAALKSFVLPPCLKLMCTNRVSFLNEYRHLVGKSMNSIFVASDGPSQSVLGVLLG